MVRWGGFLGEQVAKLFENKNLQQVTIEARLNAPICL